MDSRLQELILDVCHGFPSRDVSVSHIFDFRRFAKMVHYAWKNEIGFHPDMFKDALRSDNLFNSLSEEELEAKASELCSQADFAKTIFHAAFDLEKLTIK